MRAPLRDRPQQTVPTPNTLSAGARADRPRPSLAGGDRVGTSGRGGAERHGGELRLPSRCPTSDGRVCGLTRRRSRPRSGASAPVATGNRSLLLVSTTRPPAACDTQRDEVGTQRTRNGGGPDGGSTAAVRNVRGQDSRVSHAGRRRGKRWQAGGSGRRWRQAGGSERSAVGGTSVQLNAGKLTRKKEKE